MIKFLICSVLATISSQIAVAQHNLTIKTVDRSNQQPLQNVSVSLDRQAAFTAQSDKDGVIKLYNITAGKHTVQISFIGYETWSKSVTIENNTTLTVQLEPKNIRTEEVLVLSTRAKRNAPTTFKNISKEEITRNNLGQDIPYLLNQTPSVQVNSDAGAGIGYTGMTIRGSDNQRINVTLNGIPLNDAESMGSFFVNLPDFASSTESIQVQRGIGTSTNGAGSFGASLNIQSNTLSEKPYAELNNSFGSYNTWKNTVKLGTGLINDKFAFNARLSRISSEGYIERGASDLQSFYIDGGYYGKKHILKAIVFWGKEKTYQAWNGVPEPLISGDRSRMDDYADNGLGVSGAERDRFMNAGRNYNLYTYQNQTDNYTQKHHQLHYTNILSDKLTLNTALHYTRGYGYYEEMRPGDMLSKYGLPDVIIGQDTIQQTDLVRRRWLDNYFYGMTYALNYKPNEQFEITWGGAYNQYKGKHYGQVIWAEYASTGFLDDKYYFGKSQKNDFSNFLKVDYKLDKWIFMADIQYRNVDYRMYGDDDKVKNYNYHPKFNFVNPKIGATYLLNDKSNIYASYAFAQKEPVRKDFIEKNSKLPDPTPEKMQDIEVGYRIANEKFNIGINGYGMLYKDQLIPTGEISDTGSPIRQNVKDSYRIGLEFDGAWNINKQFSWLATASFSQNKINDFEEVIGDTKTFYPKTTIALSPSTIISSNFSYRPIAPLTFSILSKFVSRQYLDNSSAKERSISAYFVNNFLANYSFTALGIKNISASLQVNNILNEKYEANGYTFGWMEGDARKYYNFYFPQAPTNFLLGLNFKF
ncbi:TonB-dependent receptor [Sphingobacterium sp. N143]|uniref:TonB-dependent receptor n=1 Tax=Sphingobacterium sp. N143 TaxID=2746727 RepID=UPI00257567D5|nr:TonB-dependent receptor [Sphingobacterium sp. N143]MDM1295492.1 TonB-dependent receptor [Sphingobacterium sp. N143]